KSDHIRISTDQPPSALPTKPGELPCRQDSRWGLRKRRQGGSERHGRWQNGWSVTTSNPVSSEAPRGSRGEGEERVSPEHSTRTRLATAAALAGFAANSLLCRAALRSGAVDAWSFTAIRLGSGAVALALLSRERRASA